MKMRLVLKALGSLSIMTLVAAAAMASAAQAVTLHSAGSPTSFSGEAITKPTIKFPGGSVECSGLGETGSFTGTSVSSFETHPEFSGCKAFGFASTHVTSTGCFNRYDSMSGFGPYTASYHVVCSGTNKIKITPTFAGFSVCTVNITPQNPSGGVDIANNFATTHLVLTQTATGIAFAEEAGGSCGIGSGSSGIFAWQFTLRGTFSIYLS
jgi:hypothetical protein